MINRLLIFILLLFAHLGFCQNYPQSKDFDTIMNGQTISLYKLENKNGITIYLTNYGARLVSIITPDRQGNKANVILGYNTIAQYIKDMYTGPVVGRYANRIAPEPVTIESKSYKFSSNSKPLLHGGANGFNKRIWDARQNQNSIVMQYSSADMEEGFPGILNTRITYTLNDSDELIIDYEATTDKPTIINLSNHSYFNLKGDNDSSMLGPQLTLNADYYTPVDSKLIPTGRLAPVAGTPFDFRNGMNVGQMIDSTNEQLKYGHGYDHNWVLNKKSNELSFALKLYEPSTGRTMTIFTTKPGMQFYSGNYLIRKISWKSGKPYIMRSAIVLEPQHFPDSPHHANFPSTIFRPGETYKHKDVYRFSIENN